MAKPKYNYAHQQERLTWAPLVNAGQAVCAEKVCKKPSRRILPGQKWHLCHDPSGTFYIGVGHSGCNSAEGASRGNRMRRRVRRWVL